MIKSLLLLAVMFISIFAKAQIVDTVIFKSGNQLLCQIIEQTDSTVKAKFNEEKISWRKSEIQRIGVYTPEVFIPTVARTEEYCLLIGTQQLLSTKVSISIDYGQQRRFFDDPRFKDEMGTIVKFNSMIDALNYMNGQGWEFMNAYPMISNMGTAYHYLMKRKM